MARRAAHLEAPDMTPFLEELQQSLEELRQELPGCSERDGGQKAEEILWQMLAQNIVGLDIGIELSKQAIREFQKEAPSVFLRIKNKAGKLDELFS